MVENLPADAGDTGSSPGLGRSHIPRSNWAREPQLLSLRVWSLCSTTREAATVRGPRTAMKSGPRLPQLEEALTQKRRPNTAKNKFKKKRQKWIHRNVKDLIKVYTASSCHRWGTHLGSTVHRSNYYRIKIKKWNLSVTLSRFFFFFLNHLKFFFFKIIYLFIFGCVGSLFLCEGFL